MIKPGEIFAIFLLILYLYPYICTIDIFYQQLKSLDFKGSKNIFSVYVQKKEHIISKICLTIIKNHANNVVRWL